MADETPESASKRAAQVRDSGKPLIYFVVGEESGDLLGADLIDHLRGLSEGVEFAGLAGERMKRKGMKSLFDVNALSVMGFSAVLTRLPTLLARVREVVRDVLLREPDVLVLIDSPEFSRMVAKRVKAKRPSQRIVKYVCPSVWAWRPGRAKAMKAWADHVLALFPFEPKVMSELDGPPTSYAGHPLAWRHRDFVREESESSGGEGSESSEGERKTLLLLPGSREGELRFSLPCMERVASELKARGDRFDLVLPTLERFAERIGSRIADWPASVELVAGEEARERAFRRADAALAVSGTVLLELALFRVPCVAIYRPDWLLRRFAFLIDGWSGALPNLIADERIIPEYLGDLMLRPGCLARHVESLAFDSLARRSMLEGFERMNRRMRLDEPPGLSAARKVLEISESARA